MEDNTITKSASDWLFEMYSTLHNTKVAIPNVQTSDGTLDVQVSGSSGTGKTSNSKESQLAMNSEGELGYMESEPMEIKREPESEESEPQRTETKQKKFKGRSRKAGRKQKKTKGEAKKSKCEVKKAKKTEAASASKERNDMNVEMLRKAVKSSHFKLLETTFKGDKTFMTLEL